MRLVTTSVPQLRIAIMIYRRSYFHQKCAIFGCPVDWCVALRCHQKIESIDCDCGARVDKVFLMNTSLTACDAWPIEEIYLQNAIIVQLKIRLPRNSFFPIFKLVVVSGVTSMYNLCEKKTNTLPALTMHTSNVHLDFAKTGEATFHSVRRLRLCPYPFCHEHVSSLKAFIFSGFCCKYFFTPAIVILIRANQIQHVYRRCRSLGSRIALPFLRRLTITVLDSFAQQKSVYYIAS